MAAVLVPVAATGCSAAPTSIRNPPPVVVSRPADGVSLRQLGFTNGPVDVVFLPAQATITRRVDQMNVTTAFGPAAEGATVQAFLRRTLQTDVWKVDADSPGALLFANQGFSAAFTISDDLWALTIRRKPA